MGNTNFCAQYIQDNKHIEGRAGFIEFAKTAIKFRLPDYGIVMSVGDIESKGTAGLTEFPATFSKYITVMKLPYDRVVLEFNYGNDKVIVMAGNHADGTIRFTYSIKGVRNGVSTWLDIRTGVKINPDFSVQSGALSGEVEPLTNDENHIIYYVTYVILGFITALQCSNVVEADQVAEPKLNKSRVKKGKQPFFNYKVLTIDTQKNRSGKADSVSAGGRSHSSPRAHLRRGHIRRLEDKNIWVNPCVVGDKDFLSKDYKVI